MTIALKSLKSYDPSFELITSIDLDVDLQGICHSDRPEKLNFCFIKSSRFFNAIGRRSKETDFKQTGLVVEKKYYDSLDKDTTLELKKKFFWLATVADTNQAMSLLSEPFYRQKFQDYNMQVDGRKMGTSEIDPTAQIAENVFIGENVKIGEDCKILPGVTILPNVQVGAGTIIFPNVTLYPQTVIGKHCRIHAGTVIGSDGFGYNFFDNAHQKVWHLSGVTIEDHVEIGGNTMIDCGAFIETRIKSGTKIDNLVQISHNVLIGEHVIVCGTTGIAGSVEIDDYCAFGAGAGVAPNARLGKGAQLAARATVSENSIIEPGEVIGGHPGQPLRQWLRSQAVLRNLAKK